MIAVNRLLHYFALFRKAYIIETSFAPLMANLNVAVIGATEYSKDLGKKGTVSDLAFYNLKKGSNTITFIEPARYPERLAPLFFAASMAERAILVVDEINPTFGEIVIMLQCLGIKSGCIILRNYLSKEQISPILKGTVASGYDFIEDDKNALRERLLSEIESLGSEEGSAKAGSMPVDHSFSVRGVGTVALGSVKVGVIRKHDELRLLPGEKTAQVRSIQKHDEDFDWAAAGERTGLALKNVGVEDLDRGVVLTNDDSMKSTSAVVAKAEIVKYWTSPIKEGMVLHLGHWLQFVPARVESVSSDADWRRPVIGLKLEKPLIHLPGSMAVMTYPEGGKLRVVGTIELD
jgi:selenocysteine-specific translation elongation factor